MLTEYALTPHLFDDEHNASDPHWLETLRSFGDRLLPAGQDRPFNTVVTDLYDASWYGNEFVPLIENLERRQEADRTKRLPALDLLKSLRPRIERHLVTRPAVGADYPHNRREMGCGGGGGREDTGATTASCGFQFADDSFGRSSEQSRTAARNTRRGVLGRYWGGPVPTS